VGSEIEMPTKTDWRKARADAALVEAGWLLDNEVP
jgi:hypothetical protein